MFEIGKVGLIVGEEENVNGNKIDVIKRVSGYGKDFYTEIVRADGLQDVCGLNETSFACKNNDKIQIVAFGGNRCTTDENVLKLKEVVKTIFSQRVLKSQVPNPKINVTTVGYQSSPLLNDGDMVRREYVEPLREFTKRIFNIDGTIDDIKNRASNTILFSHCVGGECLNMVIDSLENALYAKGASREDVDEVLNSLIAINYANYLPDWGESCSKIPCVNLFQAHDMQNDGAKFMNMNDVYKSDKKKLEGIKKRCRDYDGLPMVRELSHWNGMIIWTNENQKTLNITLDRLKRTNSHCHSPSDLIYDDNHTEVLHNFLSVFKTWVDEVMSGKHGSETKVAVLKHKLESNGLGLRKQEGLEM